MPANCHYDRLLEGDKWARSTWTPLSLNTWRTVTEAICTQRRNSSAQRVKGKGYTAQRGMANGLWYGVLQAELEPTRCDAPPPDPHAHTYVSLATVDIASPGVPMLSLGGAKCP